MRILGFAALLVGAPTPIGGVINGCECAKERETETDYCPGVHVDQATGMTTPEECCEFCRTTSQFTTTTMFVWSKNEIGRSEPNCWCKEPCAKPGNANSDRVSGKIKDPKECTNNWGVLFLGFIAGGGVLYLAFGACYVVNVHGRTARRPSDFVANQSAWRAFGGLVADGIAFTASAFSSTPYKHIPEPSGHHEDHEVGGGNLGPTSARQSVAAHIKHAREQRADLAATMEATAISEGPEDDDDLEINDILE